MEKFLIRTGKLIIVLVALMIVTMTIREATSIMRRSRQPLNVEIKDTESPFSVSDRQEQTRTWIDERIALPD